MAANGFPAGEREGEIKKKPRRGILEPLGDVLLVFFAVGVPSVAPAGLRPSFYQNNPKMVKFS